MSEGVSVAEILGNDNKVRSLQELGTELSAPEKLQPLSPNTVLGMLDINNSTGSTIVRHGGEITGINSNNLHDAITFATILTRNWFDVLGVEPLIFHEGDMLAVSIDLGTDVDVDVEQVQYVRDLVDDLLQVSRYLIWEQFGLTSKIASASKSELALDAKEYIFGPFGFQANGPGHYSYFGESLGLLENRARGNRDTNIEEFRVTDWMKSNYEIIKKTEQQFAAYQSIDISSTGNPTIWFQTVVSSIDEIQVLLQKCLAHHSATGTLGIQHYGFFRVIGNRLTVVMHTARPEEFNLSDVGVTVNYADTMFVYGDGLNPRPINSTAPPMGDAIYCQKAQSRAL